MPNFAATGAITAATLNFYHHHKILSSCGEGTLVEMQNKLEGEN